MSATHICGCRCWIKERLKTKQEIVFSFTNQNTSSAAAKTSFDLIGVCSLKPAQKVLPFVPTFSPTPSQVSLHCMYYALLSDRRHTIDVDLAVIALLQARSTTCSLAAAQSPVDQSSYHMIKRLDIIMGWNLHHTNNADGVVYHSHLAAGATKTDQNVGILKVWQSIITKCDGL